MDDLLMGFWLVILVACGWLSLSLAGCVGYPTLVVSMLY